MRERFLLDTNVISETRKTRPNLGIAAFLSTKRAAELFLSVLTIGELRKGVAQCRSRHPSFADQLSVWVDEIEVDFEDRIVPVDLPIAQAWGQIAADRTRPVVDSLLVATAVCRGFTLVTRNVIDVRDTDARVLNPFE